MNIGINVSFLRKPYTGIGQVTTHILDELIRQSTVSKSMKNHKFFLYCEEDCDVELPKNFYKRAALPRIYKRDDLMRKVLWEKFLLPRMARKDKCDVLLSLYQSATVIRYTDMQHVMIVHDIIPRIFPEYLGNLRKKIYWELTEKGMYSSNKIIAVSEHTKIDLERKLNIKSAKISVDKISVDPIFQKDVSDEEKARILQKYKLERGYIYVGGGLEVRKNAEETIRAYALLREKWSDAPRLVVSGKLMPELSPMVTDVEKIVRELGIEKYVDVLGFVEQTDLPALYSNAKLFVFASRYEGFGMPVLESMSVGTPVLTADNSSLREVGGDTVEYTQVDNKDSGEVELSEKMFALLNDEEKLQQMSVQGRERSKEFLWEKFVYKACEIACEK